MDQSTQSASDTAAGAAGSSPGAQRPQGRSALHASVWSIGGYGASQVIRLAGNVILANLLFKEAFGLISIVMAVIQGLALFTDIGLGPNVVQSRRGNQQAYLDTVWTIQIVRGTALSVIAVLLAHPIATIYETSDPLAADLRTLLPLASLSVFISGFSSTSMLTSARELRLARLTILDFVSQLAGVVAMLFVAWWFRSYYAMPLAAIVSALVTTCGSHLILEKRAHRLHWDVAAVKEIVRFGQWLLLSTAASFLAMQLDRLVLPKLFSLGEVGLYAIAANLALLVPTVMARLQLGVAFPVYAALLREKPEEFEERFLRTKGAMLTLVSLLVAGLIACSQTFVDLVYSEEYSNAGTYLAILAASTLFACIEQTYGAAFLAQGQSRLVAISNAAKCLGYACVIALASSRWGVVGACGAALASEALKAGCAVTLRGKVSNQRLGQETRCVLLGLSIGVGVLGLLRIAHLERPIHQFGGLVAGSALVIVLYLPALLRAARDLGILRERYVTEY